MTLTTSVTIGMVHPDTGRLTCEVTLMDIIKMVGRVVGTASLYFNGHPEILTRHFAISFCGVHKREDIPLPSFVDLRKLKQSNNVYITAYQRFSNCGTHLVIYLLLRCTHI
ncbi:hypothetical protein TNCV_2665531 [Trichonephila clavipes]|nr:hypothetical protein TNCV_2665531 [Trichonephila clavipes]